MIALLYPKVSKYESDHILQKKNILIFNLELMNIKGSYVSCF